MKFCKRALVITFTVLLVLAASNAVFAAEKIKFGHVDWPGVTVKTQVAIRILDLLGYEAETRSLSLPVVCKALSSGDLDLFLAAWLPTMNNLVKGYLADGTMISLGLNLDETIYTLAVPKYVWEAGVKSHADLNKFADKFNKKIIGIEPGNDGNQLVLGMIKNNTYNLKDWKLVEGSAAAMMVAVGAAYKKNEWVCWLGWAPHWMNMVHEVKYLEDPEHIWGSEPEVVHTMANSKFPEKNPNVAKFMTQFKVTPQIQSGWIEEYSRQKKDPAKVADAWIRNNLGIVDQWVYGVTTADGKTRARDAVRTGLGL